MNGADFIQLYGDAVQGKNIAVMMKNRGHAVVQLVEALRYKPEGHGFDYRRCHWKFFIDIILPVAL